MTYIASVEGGKETFPSVLSGGESGFNLQWDFTNAPYSGLSEQALAKR